MWKYFLNVLCFTTKRVTNGHTILYLSSIQTTQQYKLNLIIHSIIENLAGAIYDQFITNFYKRLWDRDCMVCPLDNNYISQCRGQINFVLTLINQFCSETQNIFWRGTNTCTTVKSSGDNLKISMKNPIRMYNFFYNFKVYFRTKKITTSYKKHKLKAYQPLTINIVCNRFKD